MTSISIFFSTSGSLFLTALTKKCSSRPPNATVKLIKAILMITSDKKCGFASFVVRYNYKSSWYSTALSPRLIIWTPSSLYYAWARTVSMFESISSDMSSSSKMLQSQTDFSSTPEKWNDKQKGKYCLPFLCANLHLLSGEPAKCSREFSNEKAKGKSMC